MAGNGARYTKELKDKALKLSDEIGTKSAAEQCGVSIKTISSWRYARNKADKEKQRKKMQDVVIPQKVDYQKELNGNPNITFQSVSEETHEYKRGEIYYVRRGVTTGRETITGRPAVIISNDRLNNCNGVVEVVFLTSTIKPLSPEHIVIKSSGRLSTVLCEQISSVDVSRLEGFIGCCTPEEMTKIEEGILHSLGIEKYKSELMSDDQIVYRMNSIKAERDVYRNLYNELFERVTK